MIRIVSGIDPKKGGYNPRIWSDHKNTENIMREIIANGKSITEGSTIYSIHFYDQYFVFSINKIVRDPKGNDRTGTISFSIALSQDENIDICNELEVLQKKYEDNVLDFSQNYNDKLDVDIKTDTSSAKKDKKDKPENETVYVRWKDTEELKKYFCYDKNYRKYTMIFFIEEKYFIDEEYIEKNPKQSILPCKPTTFEELKKIISSPVPNPQKITYKEIIKYGTVVLLVVGIFWGGFWCYNKIEKQNQVIAKLQEEKVCLETDTLKLNVKIKTLTNNLYETKTKEIISGDSLFKKIEKQNQEITKLKTENDSLETDTLNLNAQIRTFTNPDEIETKEIISVDSLLKKVEKQNQEIVKLKKDTLNLNTKIRNHTSINAKMEHRNADIASLNDYYNDLNLKTLKQIITQYLVIVVLLIVVMLIGMFVIVVRISKTMKWIWEKLKWIIDKLKALFNSKKESEESTSEVQLTKFLRKDCLFMTISEIISKIKQFDPKEEKKLKGFTNFIKFITKNQSDDDIQNFEIDNKEYFDKENIYFDENNIYVKLFELIKAKGSSYEKIKDIEKKKLGEIEGALKKVK